MLPGLRDRRRYRGPLLPEGKMVPEAPAQAPGAPAAPASPPSRWAWTRHLWDPGTSQCLRLRNANAVYAVWKARPCNSCL